MGDTATALARPFAAVMQRRPAPTFRIKVVSTQKALGSPRAAVKEGAGRQEDPEQLPPARHPPSSSTPGGSPAARAFDLEDVAVRIMSCLDARSLALCSSVSKALSEGGGGMKGSVVQQAARSRVMEISKEVEGEVRVMEGESWIGLLRTLVR